jgi:hypothetical protein
LTQSAKFSLKSPPFGYLDQATLEAIANDRFQSFEDLRKERVQKIFQDYYAYAASVGVSPAQAGIFLDNHRKSLNLREPEPWVDDFVRTAAELVKAAAETVRRFAETQPQG